MLAGSKTPQLARLQQGLRGQAFAQAVQVIVRLVEVPLVLGFWGTQLYGEWLMVTAIPSYLAMGDGGFAGSASREMAIRVGGGDRDGALVVFRSVWLLLLALSVVLALIAGAAIWTLPVGQLLGIRSIDGTALSFVLLLLVVYVLVGFQAGLTNGGFWCEGQYGTGMLLSAIAQLLEFSGFAAAVILGGGPILAATGLLAGRVTGLLIMRFGLYKATPWLRYGWRGASRREILRLATPSLASLAFPLGNAFNIQGMRLAVGLAMGPTAVVVFSSIRTLSRLATQATTMISRLVEPEIPHLHVMKVEGARHLGRILRQWN